MILAFLTVSLKWSLQKKAMFRPKGWYLLTLFTLFQASSGLKADSSRLERTKIAFTEVVSLLNSSPANAIMVKTEMQSLKEEGIASRWMTSILEPALLDKMDLKLVTRATFPKIDDFLNEVMKNAIQNSKASRVGAINAISLSFSLFILGLGLLSFADFSQSLRNILGLLTLSLPFMVIGIGVLAPAAVASFDDQINKALSSEYRDRAANQQKRVIYHEAGHFLAGNLCGIPVVDYDISGQVDAGIAVLAELRPSAPSTAPINSKSTNKSANQSGFTLDSKTAGGLLIVALAGVVAESIVFGDSTGGVQDFPIAFEIARKHAISQDRPGKDNEECYLRWALTKALAMLKVNRDALDRVAVAMGSSASIVDCMVAIEFDKEDETSTPLTFI